MDSINQLPICPVCGAPYHPGEPSCAACGLVFATATLPALPLAAQRVTPVRSATAVAAPLLRSGTALGQGRYTLIRPLGQGGMGALYLGADHENFDRTVVIKVQTDHLEYADPAAVRAAQERFVAEARTLATLRHPAIPQIFAHFAEDGQNYIVMEYIEGQDLEQQLSRPDEATGQPIIGKPYPIEQVLRWGIDLCGVLEYLASRTPPVVHQDLKPANLLLDASNQSVRVIDFGTARARAAIPGTAARKTTIFGTSGYAAPEQYRGISAPASDIYALAATLYHLATDDDPRNRPFSFPRLADLGPFGTVLSYALDQEPQRRPTAAKLRSECEALVRGGLSATIEAPDGTRLAKPLEIVQWAEQHWDAARAWVGGPLTEQIAVRWGQTRRAHELRAAASRHAPGSDAALDAVLAQLDPAGFGEALPRLTASRYALDFGRLSAGPLPPLTVRLTNQGRRSIAATLHARAWFRLSAGQIALRPGAAVDITVTADAAQWLREGNHTEQLDIRDGDITLRAIDLVGHAGRFLDNNAPRSIWPVLLMIAAVVFVWTLWRGAGQPPAAAPLAPQPTAVLARAALATQAPTATPAADLFQESGALIAPRQTVRIGCGGGLTTLSISPDGTRLAALCANQEIQIVPLNTPDLPIRVAGAGGGRTALGFTADGSELLIAAADRTERRRVADLGLVRTVAAGGEQLDALGGYVLRRSGRAVEVWSLADGSLVYSAPSPTAAILSVNLLALIEGGGLTLVDLRRGAVTLLDSEVRATWVCADPRGQQVITGDAAGQRYLTDLASGRRHTLPRTSRTDPWLAYLAATKDRGALGIGTAVGLDGSQVVYVVRPALPTTDSAALRLLRRVQGIPSVAISAAEPGVVAVYDSSGLVELWDVSALGS